MPGDALDDLLDDDEVANDIFRDVDTNMNIPSRRKAPSETDGPENSLGLGIDEEVKITKKKKPIVKLDENRYSRCIKSSILAQELISNFLGFYHKLEFLN